MGGGVVSDAQHLIFATFYIFSSTPHLLHLPFIYLNSSFLLLPPTLSYFVFLLSLSVLRILKSHNCHKFRTMESSKACTASLVLFTWTFLEAFINFCREPTLG